MPSARRASRNEDDCVGYLRLVGTFSDHLLLPDAQRQALFDGLRTCIERAGGTIVRRYETVLFLGRRPT